MGENISANDRHIETFRIEAETLLSNIEEVTLELEQSPDDKEAVDRIFRSMHTIKGSSGMFGFDNISSFTHHVESILDHLREGTIMVSKKLIDLILEAKDKIREMLDDEKNMDVVDNGRIIAQLQTLLPEELQEVTVKKAAAPVVDQPSDSQCTYRIRFHPSPTIMQTGQDPIRLLDELREMGECTITPFIEDLPDLKKMNPELCYFAWDIILTTAKGENAIKDVFIFVSDDSKVDIQFIDTRVQDEPGSLAPRLGDILVDRGDVTKQQIRKVMGDKKKIGELLVDACAVTKEEITSALKEQKIIEGRRTESKMGSVRVPFEKLDTLVNLVGELVTNQASLSQLTAGTKDRLLSGAAENLKRLTDELRDNVLNIRMMPIGVVFNKFKRLVRDLAADLDKEISLVIEGGETELDKTVLEKLNEPLVHLIRNCIDHGIENPAIRKSTDKAARGTIRLSAAHEGATVSIKITDDGAGLNKETILKKAIEKKLINPDEQLNDRQIYSLIFEPGFSTASTVTNVSGRGVGMDVVKRQIDSLRGNISIESEADKGTKITLSLPLTLAIIEGLLVKVANHHYIIPLSLVSECIELSDKQAMGKNDRNLIPIRGELVPFVPMREFFRLSGERSMREQMVLVQTDDGSAGIVVDQIIGDHQAVIKSLGSIYNQAEGVSGATIMGDGSVALIIDIPGLIRSVKKTEKIAVNN